jgi:hypothetical protein
LSNAIRGKAHHLHRIERPLQHRLGLAKHFGAIAIAALDSAIAHAREHLLEPNRDRCRKERLELLFWLTPPWHERWAA